MDYKVNYIKAHKAIQLLIKNDVDLRPIHKSMIDAIFMYWNTKEWVELFNIDRDSLMEYSKVSNRKTYYEILTFLQLKEYIVYKPSKNPDIASVFGMGKKVTSAITSDLPSPITSAITSDGSSGGTIYINIQTLKQETLKLINDNASLVDSKLKIWINESKEGEELPPPIDYDKFMLIWNESVKGKKIPSIIDIDVKRKIVLNRMLKDYSKEKLREAIYKISKSDFANGINDRKWIASFDWVFKSNNFIKILEGNYDNKPTVNDKAIY